MRKIRVRRAAGTNVEELLEEFNERAAEFAIKEADIISISATPPTTGIPIATPTGSAAPKVELFVFYWSKD